jgi:hypothetical protein
LPVAVSDPKEEFVIEGVEASDIAEDVYFLTFGEGGRVPNLNEIYSLAKD